ncbi:MULTISPECIES: hypothetical protein [Halocynthiibacter]|uniref:Uncharacterized protein n=1 Tax=Halocynthiibacter halioticoli TaxID=2986804 RepID=A0AAE3J166_9RHOB|nr:MULTISPECIES: hypothetical protein [Halocynthiibacter]MCV6825774.1 hypothetical protein [Halocynthiibacter halioticoli]MCW4058775.1 hypothetical protein [Halocynthiibacter sp. SDUM655004]
MKLREESTGAVVENDRKQSRGLRLPLLAVSAFGLITLWGCGATEDEVRTAATVGASAALAAEASEEAKKATDYDAIAKEAVADVDTTGFDALTD